MNINGLRIVIEQTPEGYSCVYVGKDGIQAAAAMNAETPNWRMEFRPMTGTRRNRPTLPSASEPVASEPVSELAPESVVETPKTESPKSKKSK